MNSDETYMTPEDEELDLESLVEFADNPEPRCACVLLLDVSSSMYGEPIAALNQGVATYVHALRGDALASLRVETAIVPFNHAPNLEQDFATANMVSPVSLRASGGTAIGAAAIYALDLIEERKKVYRQAGAAYYRPWIILITDGASGDSISEASRRVHEAEEAKQVAFFCVGVEGALMSELNALAPRGALPLDGLAFGEFFQWLSASMTSVSSSRVDDEINLPDPSGWAKL